MEASLISLPTLRTLFLAGLLQLFVGLSLYAWGVKVGRRLGGPWWRRAPWLPLAGVLASAAGILYALWQLRRVEQALRSAPASEKASRMAEGISSMMAVSGSLAVLAWALCIASIVIFTIGSLRSAAPSPAPPPEEPPSEDGRILPGSGPGGN